MRTLDIAWVAGVLEGEGCFLYGRTPTIQVGITDLDVVQRLRSLMKWDGVVHVQTRPDPQKDCYIFSIYGRRAIAWMLTLYALLGQRRRAKIREIVARWKTAPSQRRRRRW